MNKRVLSAVALAAVLSSTVAGCAGQAAQNADAGSNATSSAVAAAGSAQTSAQPTTQISGASASGWTDGTYTGDTVTMRYGGVQVQAVIKDGQLTDVQFLSLPSDRESQEINNQAGPMLVSAAVQSQSAQVDTISGATMTSQAFIQSLASALSQAEA